MSDLSNFSFVLPHWFYWGWLAVMPLLMMAWDRWSSSRGVQAIDKNALANEKLQQIEAEMSKTIESDYENWFTRIIDWISEKSRSEERRVGKLCRSRPPRRHCASESTKTHWRHSQQRQTT